MVPTATNKSRFQIEVTGYILDEKSLVKKYIKRGGVEGPLLSTLLHV